MTQETKDMIVLLQLEFSAEIEQADHDPKYSYRIFQRKTGNPIYQACRFSDMFRFFNIGPSMKIEDIDKDKLTDEEKKQEDRHARHDRHAPDTGTIAPETRKVLYRIRIRSGGDCTVQESTL